MKSSLLGASLLLVAATSLAAQMPSPAFAFTPPTLAGAYGNVIGDHLQLERAGSAVRGSGNLGGRDVTLEAEAIGGTANGTARWADAASGTTACGLRGDGDVLVLAIGDSEWRLVEAVPLDESLAQLGEPEPDPARNWTVAIYMGGDNDLEGDALRDLLEMKAGMPAKGCEVVVLIDRHRDADDGENEWSDARVLRVTPGDDGMFDRLGEPAERDMGSPTTLASFVAGAFRRYPSKHHAVVIWDHGGGWTGIVTDEDPPGSGKKKTMLSLQAVRDGLRTGMNAAGVLQLDLLAFDACLMAQLDVAVAMHDLADTMIASEATVPGTGYPYTGILPRFADDTSGREIARTVVEQYGSFSDNEFESGSTLCAFDLAKAPAVAAQLDVLAKQAKAACANEWAAVARALFYAECYQSREKRVLDNAVGSIDLLDFAGRLRGVAGVDGKAIDALEAAVGELVIARFSGAERTLSRGLAIYGPHRKGQFDDDYETTPLARGNAWRQFLGEVHDRADRDTSALAIGDFRQQTATGAETKVSKPFNGDRLLFSATGDSIVEVVARTWQRDAANDQWMMLRVELVTDPMWPARWATAAAADMTDLVMPQFAPGKNDLYFELAGLTFAITDGTLVSYGSLDFAQPSLQAPIHAIARYTEKATGWKGLVDVTFDRAEWRMIKIEPIERPAPGTLPRSLEAAAGDTFEFWLMTRDKDGKQGGMFTPALTYGDRKLQLIAEAEEPGDYRIGMEARTIGGRRADAEHEYSVEANADLESWSASWKDFDPSRLVGTWRQYKVTGPQQYQDLLTTCTVEPTAGPNLFKVLTRGGPQGGEFETHQFWNFEWGGLPSLRVVTIVADGQRFGWYGPARVATVNGKRVLAMKAVNAVGVVWEWRQQ